MYQQDVIWLIEALTVVNALDFTNLDLFPEDNVVINIKKELFDSSKTYYSCWGKLDWLPLTLDKFEGYSLLFLEREGEHSNDGQVVDYYFLLSNLENKECEFCLEKSLMGGWRITDKNELIFE